MNLLEHTAEIYYNAEDKLYSLRTMKNGKILVETRSLEDKAFEEKIKKEIEEEHLDTFINYGTMTEKDINHFRDLLRKNKKTNKCVVLGEKSWLAKLLDNYYLQDTNIF